MDQQDEYGRTALHVASEDNDIDTVKRLVKEGSNIQIKDNLDRTALYSSVLHSAKEVYNFLRGIKVDSHNIHDAAENDSVQSVEYFISRGVDVDKLDKYGRSPLHIASHFNSVRVSNVLIDHGADIQLKDNYGRTPLHKTSTGDNSEVAQLLIQSGADVNATNTRGNTPLHVSSLKNSLNVSKLLLENGADVNSHGMNNMTATLNLHNSPFR